MTNYRRFHFQVEVYLNKALKVPGLSGNRTSQVLGLHMDGFRVNQELGSSADGKPCYQ